MQGLRYNSPMKFIFFHYKGRRYRIKTTGLLILVLCITILTCSFILGCRYLFGKGEKNANTNQTTMTNQNIKQDSQAPVEDGTVLSTTQDAGTSYIEDTLFLGDSNTARFSKVVGSGGKTFTTKNNAIGVVGMGIDAITTLACMRFSTGIFTMPDAVKILQPRRIIMTFGTNNLSGDSTDASSFITRYTSQIEAVQKAYPSADLIINAIPPVSKTRLYPNISMKQIDAYNQALMQMCEKNGWKFLNSAEILKDESSGYAKQGYTVDDGLHLSAKGIETLFTYIRTHAWNSEDRRHKPLSAIPDIIGVPDGLIKIDPLTEENFTNDPSEDTESKTETGCIYNGGRWNAEKSICEWGIQEEIKEEIPACDANQHYDEDQKACVDNPPQENSPQENETEQQPEASVSPSAQADNQESTPVENG